MPLNTSFQRIMDDAKIIGLPNLPKRKNPVVKLLNARKYYKYHRNWSHDINECVTLKNEIEKLMCKGHLHQYKKSDHG